MAKILPASSESTQEAVLLLQKGLPVALPTETVYGLAADATNADACTRIFEAKGRPANDPLIVHVSNLQQAEEFAQTNPTAERLAAHFWPGPLTLLLPKRPNSLPDLVTSGLNTVAVRSPDNAAFQSVLRASALPLAAPSANRFGRLSPTSAQAVEEELGDKISLIIDGGSCEVGVESTILDITDETAPRILRPGAITASQIEAFIGRPVLGTSALSPTVPGSLPQHYQPQTPLNSFELTPPQDPSTEFAVIYFHQTSQGAHTYNLSHDGSSQNALHNLYALLRELDKRGYHQIFIQTPPKGEANDALRNRLARACAKG